MGIIQRQALKSGIANFGGVIFGAFSRLWMPFFMSTAQIGVLALLDSVAGILSTFFNLGFGQIAIRLFPVFRNESNGHHGFFLFGIYLSVIGAFLGGILFYAWPELFLGNEKNELLDALVFLIIPLTFFKILFSNIDVYTRMIYNAVIGSVLNNVITKIAGLLVITLYYLSWIDFQGLAYLYVFVLCLPGLFICVYAFKYTTIISRPHKSLWEADRKREMFEYGSFGILMGASASIVMFVDQLMVNTMINVDAVGIYATMFFAAMLISIPAKAIKRIAAVIVADSWKAGDNHNLLVVYQKSGLNLMIMGAYLFFSGWLLLPFMVINYLPDYSEGIYVFFFLGLGQLADMLSGVNAEIIAASDKYKVNTYFNVLLAVLVIVLNYFLIPWYGISGCAFASMLAVIGVNVLRWYYLKKMCHLQPFDFHFLKTFVLTMLIGMISFLSVYASGLFDIIILFGAFSICYWLVVIKLKLSKDINDWIYKIKSFVLGS